MDKKLHDLIRDFEAVTLRAGDVDPNNEPAMARLILEEQAQARHAIGAAFGALREGGHVDPIDTIKALRKACEAALIDLKWAMRFKERCEGMQRTVWKIEKALGVNGQ